MADKTNDTPAMDVQAQINILTAALAEQKEIAAKQQETILALQSKETVIETKKKAKAKIPSALVEHKGKKHKWNVPHFRLAGSDEVITAEDAATDEDLIAKIIETPGQGILSPIF